MQQSSDTHEKLFAKSQPFDNIPPEMDFTEKLRTLTKAENKSRIAGRAEMPASAISNYIGKKQIPRADAALKLARALDVSLEWLVDDAKDFPPEKRVNNAIPVADMPTNDLMAELARRYRLELLDALRLIEDMEKWDWPAIGASVKRDPESQHPRMKKLADLLGMLTTIAFRYDVRAMADFLHDRLPGKERAVGELTTPKLVNRAIQLRVQPSVKEHFDALEQAAIDEKIMNEGLLPYVDKVFAMLFGEARIKALAESRGQVAPATAQALPSQKSTPRHRKK